MNGKALICAALLVITPCCAILALEPAYDVPYVPTITEVVDVMLAMGCVRGDDVLYDLGCGDGRIVITAAERFGCRGVGIDINPVRIRESTANAKKAGVSDTVHFLNQDLFATDISTASVVTLYLLPEINLRLRPILFEQLRPGTRVVSHNYHMGEWDADAFKDVSDVKGSYSAHYVYYWKIPANISGTWTISVTGSGTTKDYTLNVAQRFQKVTGTFASGAVKRPVALFTLTGTELAFTLDGALIGASIPVKLVGAVKGDTMRGSVVATDGTSPATWTARRDPATKKSIHVAADSK